MTPTAYGIIITFGMFAYGAVIAFVKVIGHLAKNLAPEGYESDDGFCYGRREDGE